MLKGNTKDLKIVDGTWFFKGFLEDDKSPFDNYCEERITEDTVFFDHDVVCDHKSDLPHTMPNLKEFIKHMKRL